MNRAVVFFIAGFFVLNIASGIRAEEITTQCGRFGKIALYQPSAYPAHVVLFVSGDGGWAELDQEISANLAGRGIPVVGVHSLKSRVELIALLGPALQVDFEFHLSSWLGSISKTALPTMPEIVKLGNSRLLCIYGEQETDSLCPNLQANDFKKVALRGAHHFGGNYAQIVETILGEMK